MKPRLIIFLFIIIILLIVGCGSRDKNDSGKSQIKSDSLVITLNGQNGRSVFEITIEKYEVDYTENSMGVFVKGIDSVESGSGFTWIFSVNDSVGQTASDKYITGNSDIVKWHFRKY